MKISGDVLFFTEKIADLVSDASLFVKMLSMFWGEHV